MKYELIKQLITYAEAFEQQTPVEDQQTVSNFIAWLNQQFALTYSNQFDDPDNMLSQADSPDTLISIMAAYLYRYTRLYSKKALENSQLTTLDEFSYLVMLLEGPAPTKTELIERNIHEKTTGIEILRRLIGHGLIEQFDDPTDRRSKRLQLTDQGRTELFGVMPLMGQVATLVGGNLTIEEKLQLVYLLNKLHLFHNPIFRDERGHNLEVLIKKMTDET